jgi:DNA-binding response OmpR family regulator
MVGAITALVGTEGHQVITAYDGLTAGQALSARKAPRSSCCSILADARPGRVHGRRQIRRPARRRSSSSPGESAEEAEGPGARDRGRTTILVEAFGKAELLARIAAVMRRVDRATGRAGDGAGERGRAWSSEPARHEARSRRRRR